MYKNILVSVDFFSETEKVIEKASAMSERMNAQVHLVHVIEDPVPMYDAYTLPSLPVIDMAEVREQLLKKLHTLADAHNIPQDHCHIEYGSVSKAIIDFSNEIKADLIIAGSHGRHGIGLMLLGSTSGSVLHHANVDFLAVRVQ